MAGAGLTRGRVDILAAAGWAAAAFAITLPAAVEPVGANLDESWRVGLLLGARLPRQWGSQVIFTYGPLGYLDYTRYLFFDQWLTSFIVNVAMHAVFVGALVLLLVERRARVWGWVLVGGLLFLPLPALPSLEHECVLATLALLIVAAATDRPGLRILGAAGAGVLVALLAMVKGTSLLSGAAVLAVFACFAIWPSLRRAVLVALASALIAFVLLWLIAGQQLTGIPTYVAAELQVIGGYSAAMGVDGNVLFPANHLNSQLRGCVLLAVLIAGQVGYAALRRDWAAFRVLLLSAPVLFVEFKEGFIRYGANQMTFYAMLALVEAMVVVSLVAARPAWPRPPRQHWPRVVALATPGLVAVGIAVALVSGWAAALKISPDQPSWPLSNLQQRAASYNDAYRLIGDQPGRDPFYSDITAAQRKAFGLTAEQVRQLTRAGTDVAPWDIAMVTAYDLNYQPRPVMQSYSAYTPYLDQLDAASWAAPDGPGQLVVTYGTIDDRYAAFDEPATFRTMLEKYRVADGRPPWLLLQRREPQSYQETRVAEQQSVIGRSNPVPGGGQGSLYAYVHMQHGILGRLADIFYKPAATWITLEAADGRRQRYHFVPAVAADGLYMSSYITNTSELQDVLSGRTGSAITSFTITVDRPVSEYQPTITIEYRRRTPG